MSNAQLRAALRFASFVMICYAIGSVCSVIAVYPYSVILAGAWVVIAVVSLAIVGMWLYSLKGWDGDDG